MPLRMRVHEREPIGLALRRFKKLLERSGIQKELRKRKYYEKPCEARRRAELRNTAPFARPRMAAYASPRGTYRMRLPACHSHHLLFGWFALLREVSLFSALRQRKCDSRVNRPRNRQGRRNFL